METLNYRMIQRKGKESDLPSNPRDGEIYITTDTNTMYFGSSGKINKVPTMNDVGSGSGGSTAINNTLTSTSTTEALSANMGNQLKITIDNHTKNNDIHVTSAEKAQWNAKAPTTVASATTNGLMTSDDKIKLNSIAVGATNTTVNDTLTSTSTTEALSANQGRILKDLIGSGGTGGTTVVNTLTSTSTTDALSAYQGKVLNDKINSSNISNIYQNNVTSSATGTAFGKDTESIGNLSFTANNRNIARGNFSNAFGWDTIAENFASTAIGIYSKMNPSGHPTGLITISDAFVIGNGTSNRSNAFRVTFDGKVYGLSSYNTSGADYAEYFEWLDGNVDNEDRVGYFVTLKGKKIHKANSTDDYVLGVISSTPSVLGNSASEGWNEQYVKDDFGRIQYHYVDVPREELDEEGNKVTVIKQEYHPIYNPNYDNEAEYVNRENRPEWDAVGMLGQLYVYDDGTCEIDSYCSSNDDGIATKSDEGYRVIDRIKDNIVQIIFK